ncbi:potassium-transporting ATPase subunit KdpC [Aurantimonas sp. VKM B-3413]|uniref:potassium-transporting ATPase subunit KdpC n=1 Tax=Aurantimonas sp. VKM B-3413 TaxID=2779401 RepID=UPI001E54306F|nr:potassium-transporting ATPase subunit KdpC [Aurantimonas sp. VKM B-3413]MCB8840516.1 potassium-transporting ATPase subunit KdpC [Aurantimonas sp. VKM B-3413]
MFSEFRPALVMITAMTLLTGVAYPLAMTGVSQALFPDQANGSLVSENGKVIGSALVAQSFTQPGYFHPRPSAANYDGGSSGGSNLGPTSAALQERITADTARLSKENPGTPIPVDLVTTSGSGLDPDISPAAAEFQAPRIASARGLAVGQVRDLVRQTARGRTFGLLGEPRVNVLALNLALDRLAPPAVPAPRASEPVAASGSVR